MKRGIFFLIIILFFALLYNIFNSNSYTVADGNMRCVEVFNAGKPYLHGNNHMLYPVNIYYFNKFLERFGIKSEDGFKYFRHSEIMNAVAGALSLGIVYLILSALTGSSLYSILGVLCLGFTKTFLECATNPNEAMVGFFFNVLSIWFFYLSISRNKIIYSCLSGAFLSYAIATYSAMSSGAAVILVYIYKIFLDKDNRVYYVKLTFFYLVSLFAGIVIIYGISYNVFLHITNFREGLKQFLRPYYIEEGRKTVWGTLYLKNFILIFYAFIQAIFQLPYYELREAFLGEHKNYGVALVLVVPIMLTAGTWIMLSDASLRLIKAGRKYAGTTIFLIIFLAGAVSYPLYIQANHSKLWSQPIAVFVVLATWVFATSFRIDIYRNNARRIKIFLSIFFIIMMAWNISNVLIPNHAGEKDLVTLASNFDDLIEKNSLVFIEWDRVGPIFGIFFKGQRDTVSVPTLVMTMLKHRVVEYIDSEIEKAKGNNRQVYFIGLLNKPKYKWNLFFGKMGISYESFQKYRDRTKLVASFDIKSERYFLYKYE